MRSIGESLFLFYLLAKTCLFNLLEERKLKKLFYTHPCFRKTHQTFCQTWRYSNPYRICKAFLKKQGQAELHTYGETPFTVFVDILQKAEFSSKDCLLDLGCGRGKLLLLTSALFTCDSIGVDQVPLFCQRAKACASFLSPPPLFLCQDFCNMEDVYLQKATLIYFYALFLSEDQMLSMLRRFEALSSHVKIITISFPLSDYSPLFTHTSWQALYPWGQAEVFLNQKKHPL